MEITGGTIRLENMRFYSYHGAAPQERVTGAWYRVDIEIQTDFTQAVLTDSLDGTVDYSKVAITVKNQMETPSLLLEHVAGRIGQALMREFPQISRLTVSVAKENPPVCCPCKASACTVTFSK